MLEITVYTQRLLEFYPEKKYPVFVRFTSGAHAVIGHVMDMLQDVDMTIFSVHPNTGTTYDSLDADILSVFYKPIHEGYELSHLCYESADSAPKAPGACLTGRKFKGVLWSEI